MEFERFQMNDERRVESEQQRVYTLSYVYIYNWIWMQWVQRFVHLYYEMKNILWTSVVHVQYVNQMDITRPT